MSKPHSLNFDFLYAHDPRLELYAARAERYVFDDPNTSVIKLRQFAELLARHVAAFHGIETTDDDFRHTLTIIRDKRLGTREIVDLFELLRLQGNEAVHEGTSDRRTALAALITAHRLAGWFQQTFVDSAFRGGVFRPPPDPADVAETLREELNTLRGEAARFQQELAEARGEAKELAGIRADLERQAKDAQQDLLAKEAQLANTERRNLEEKQAYEEQLRQVARKAAKKPPDELISFIDRSRRAARDLGLRGPESQHVPLAHVRLVGPTPSTCHGAPTLLVQSMRGGFVTANCSVCAKSSSLRESDFLRLGVWVSCPKCRTRMTATKVWSNYGFECDRCKWRCLLASLLPGWDEL